MAVIATNEGKTLESIRWLIKHHNAAKRNTPNESLLKIVNPMIKRAAIAYVKVVIEETPKNIENQYAIKTLRNLCVRLSMNQEAVTLETVEKNLEERQEEGLSDAMIQKIMIKRNQ
jgi:hypothetical protein